MAIGAPICISNSVINFTQPLTNLASDWGITAVCRRYRLLFLLSHCGEFGKGLHRWLFFLQLAILALWYYYQFCCLCGQNCHKNNFCSQNGYWAPICIANFFTYPLTNLASDWGIHQYADAIVSCFHLAIVVNLARGWGYKWLFSQLVIYCSTVIYIVLLVLVPIILFLKKKCTYTCIQ